MLHPKMRYVYVGIDSHKETHCAVILNCFFEKLGEIGFRNAPSEYEGFFAQIQQYGTDGADLAFGLEDVSAYGRALAVFLSRKGKVVKHVNAALVASERKSLNTLHKTDPFDAECAARVLLSRFDNLPDAEPQDKCWVLKNLVARRKMVVRMNTALKSQLHSFLASHYPSYHKFFVHIDGVTSLVFFDRYPSPSALRDVTEEELAVLLESHSNKRLRLAKARQILEFVANDGDTTSEHQEMRDFAIKSIIRQMRENIREMSLIDGMLETFLGHFDFDLTSMKGVDTVLAAYLMAEIGDISRFPSPAKLARYSGVAPVTYSSGKTDMQYANQRGNRALNSLFYRLAVMVTMTAGPAKKVLNPFFYDYCHRKMSEGKTKHQALICVMRRLVNIIWGMMKHGADYINPPTYDLPNEEAQSLDTATDKS